VLGAQVMAEVGPIDMLANGFLIPDRDPGSLDGYADSLSVHMRSVSFGLRFFFLEVISGYAVHMNIPQSSIGECLARELVVVLMRLNPGTFESRGPILAKSLRKSRNDIGIVWLSPPLFELKKRFGSSDRTLTVKFSLVLAFGAHRGVA
jgi:hypothetical protein